MPFAFSFQLLWHEMHSGPWEYELAFVSIEVYRLPRPGEVYSDVLVKYGLHQEPRSSTPSTSHFEVESDSKEIWRKGTWRKFYLSSGKNDFKKLKISCLEIQLKSRTVKCLQAQHLAAWASISGGLTTDAKGSQAELREHVFIQGVWAPFPWQTSYWRHKKTLWPNRSPSLALGKRQSPVQQRFRCHLGIPEHSMTAVNLGDGGFIGETDRQALAADLQLGFKIQNDLGALVCCIRRWFKLHFSLLLKLSKQCCKRQPFLLKYNPLLWGSEMKRCTR